MREKAIASLDNTKKYLVGLSDELIRDFKIVQQGFSGLDPDISLSKVFLLDIEIFPDGYGIALYPMDRDLTQLGFMKLLEKYPDGPLRGVEFGLDINSYDFENREDISEINEYYNQLTEFYVNWASQCWDEAGGQKFKIPIYIMMHDSNTSFDLSSKKWVDNRSKWS